MVLKKKVQKTIQITLVWLSLASCHQLGGSPACEKKVASNCSRWLSFFNCSQLFPLIIMLLVSNNLSFVYLGSASWEEFVRKSELESENSTFKLRLVNYDHYHQIIKKYLNKTKETSPVSPTRARPQRHPPSGEKSSKLSCPEMGFGAFYMFGIYWLLGGFRRGPNCVTHITHSHILCTVPPGLLLDK